jgi:hypothetical protein
METSFKNKHSGAPKKADEKDRWPNYRRLLKELRLARPKKRPCALKRAPDAEIGTMGGFDRSLSTAERIRPGKTIIDLAEKLINTK